MTDTRTDATALEALAVRVESGETGREIESACWFALHPEFRKWGGPSMYVPKGDPDYYGRTEAATAATGSVYDAYVKHGTPLWSGGRNFHLLTVDGYICKPDGGYMKNPKRRYVPDISTSLDAVAALAERVLPGRGWKITLTAKSTELAQAGIKMPHAVVACFQGDRVGTETAVAPTECAARLAAILRAKAKEAE
jgi:hypothetical protein